MAANPLSRVSSPWVSADKRGAGPPVPMRDDDHLAIHWDGIVAGRVEKLGGTYESHTALPA